MLRSARRTLRLPLAVIGVILLLASIAWLLVHRTDRVWDPAGRFAASALPVSPAAALPGPTAPEARGAVARSPAPDALPRATRPPARYVLESGPFTSIEVADRLEDQLNQLGHATVRFRKQDAPRIYVVAVTGSASRDEAEQMARQIGRGTVVEAGGEFSVLVHRLSSLREAVEAARALRAQGFEARVTEAVSPAVIYHIRYGHFARRADALAFREDLARSGITSRIVKIR